MAVTQNSFTGNGSTTTYSFTFPYLKQDEIKASLDGTATTAFTTPTATTVQFNTAPGNGVKIKIFRETNTDSLAATFYAGSAIKSEDLNDNYTQNLYAVQEVTARYLSNLGGTMTGDLNMGEDTKIVFEGDTDNAHETTLTVVDPTADRTITLPNITGTVVTTGDTGTVAAGMIAADAINGTKIADNAINSEHYTDGSIDHEHLANNVIDGDNIQDDVINSEHIAAGALDTEHYAANSVDADALAHTAVTAGTYTAADITVDAQGRLTAAASGEIAGSEIAADAIDGSKIADNALDSEHYTDGSIDTQHIGADQITNALIADNQIDSEHYVDGSIDRVHLSADIIDGTKLADNAVNTEHIAANAVTTNEIADAELTTLAGMQSGTASILADSTALTATTSELNILDNKSFRASADGALTTTSDTEIPSSKVVANHVAAQIGTVGGFTTIATEVAFPATASQPASGVIISISDAQGVVVNGSGVSTTGRTTDGTPATVTINSFPSSLNGETLASGVGLLVTSTGSNNTYTYHKLLAAENDVKQLSDDINDFNARYRVASSAPGSNNDDGDLWFDTSANKMKVYNATGSSWDDVASVGNFYINTISSSSGTGGGSATFNGSAYRFTLSNAPTMAQQLIVSVNGVIQKPNTGSSQPSEGFAISGSDIIFSTAPASGSDYFIVTQGSSVSIGTPSDNTVATGKIQNLAVTNDKIANDSIAEVKLDVHNAPATGKYLKYTSNGMEWADGASEGTDVKSTGESGTAKFLRVDGDGTCSWQVPPNTQVGGATGVDFDDSVKARFGTGNDLEIYHASNESKIVNSTGSIWLQSDTGIRFTDHGVNQSMAAFYDNGACELYHNGTKKIETTSSGINVTGSINVNGAALSTAPTITATADGAIAANKPVVLQDNGTVKEISGTSDAAGSRTAPSSDTIEHQKVVFDPDTNKTVFFWVENGNGNNLKYKVATPAANNSISFGTERTAVSGSVAAVNAVYSTVHDKYVIAYRGTNGNLYFKAGSMDSGNDSITWGSEYATPYQAGIENYRIALACDDDNGTVACAYRKSSTDNYIVGMLTSSSNNNLTVSSNGKDLGSSVHAHADDMVYDTNTNKYQVLWERINADTVQVNYFSVDSSDGDVTYSTSGAVLANYHSHDPRFKYDPVNQVYCAAWTKLSDSQVYARAFTFNGSAYTLGDEISKSSTTTEPQDAGLTGRPSIQMHYNPDAGHFGYEYRAEPGGTYSGQHRLVRFSVSGTTTTEAIGDTLVGDDSYVNQLTGSYDTNLNKIVYAADTGNGHRGYVFAPEQSNLNATKFLGFSTAAVSDTNTATIAITANTTTQSGLTAARKYYITKTGGLSLTASNPSVEAGLSLSSTKLLIKG